MDLSTLPDGVREAGSASAGLDRCLVHGFARLGDPQKDDLDALARVFAGSPLAEEVAQAAAAVRSGTTLEEALRALAFARLALDGARHDALLAQAAGVLGLEIGDGPELEAPAELEDGTRTLLGSVRQWLVEVALAGFRQLTAETVAPISANLDELCQRPRAARAASLLIGFAGELLEAVPTAALPEIPERRWSDLWCRAFLAAAQPPQNPARQTVTGVFQPLGADLRHHDHLASLCVPGLLAAGDDSRLARVTISSWKVDAVCGEQMWKLFEARASVLLDALVQHRGIRLDGATITSAGDLLWPEDARLDGKAHPLLLAASLPENTTLSPPAPLDRHPVQLALPVALAESTIAERDGELHVETQDGALPLALERVSPLAGLDVKSLRAAKALIGLLRFDRERWAVQPLWAAKAPKGKPRLIGPGQVIAAARKAKAATAADILTERAGKLLRA